MSSDPLSVASQTLSERANFVVGHGADEKNNAAVRKPASKASEHASDPPAIADLVHHRGDKVCDVELVPVRKRKLHNVLTRMKDESLRGPLGVMRRCMSENIKVKVITRNYKHVRGICTGYILAFDKHWNLALKDVDEVYKNPIPKPTTKRKKRQRKTKEKMSEAVPEGKELTLKNEKLKSAADVESAADLLRCDFDTTDPPSAEDDDADSCTELESKLSSSVESLKEKRKCILERLQELSYSAEEDSSSECEESEVGDLRRCSDVAFKNKNLRLVSMDERRSSTSSSAAGSRLTSSSKTCTSKKSFEPSKWKSSRTDVSDLSLKRGDVRDAECATIEKNVRGKKPSAQTNAKLKATSSRHCEAVRPVMREPEIDLDSLGVNQGNLTESNRRDCDESQQTWQSWLVRHVNQLFIRGDNVVLVSIDET